MPTDAEWIQQLLTAEAKNKELLDELATAHGDISTCKAELARLYTELSQAKTVVNASIDRLGKADNLVVQFRALLDELIPEVQPKTQTKIKARLTELDSA